MTLLSSQGIEILKCSRQILSFYNIKLHKIVSNDLNVLKAFPQTECAASQSEVEFSDDVNQRALGVAWKVKNDEFFMMQMLNLDLLWDHIYCLWGRLNCLLLYRWRVSHCLLSLMTLSTFATTHAQKSP